MPSRLSDSQEYSGNSDLWNHVLTFTDHEGHLRARGRRLRTSRPREKFSHGGDGCLSEAKALWNARILICKPSAGIRQFFDASGANCPASEVCPKRPPRHRRAADMLETAAPLSLL